MKKNLKRKSKINSKNKSYEISQSCFYKLGSLKKLASLLNTEVDILKRLQNDDNYRIFTRNGRVIEQPLALLDRIHTRVASLLSRITPTDCLQSGIKTKSHITNARVHLGTHPLLTTDIQGFYRSTSREMIYKFFRSNLRCSKDVSNYLSDICCCNGHIPTGSRISMIIAYWANKPMFDEFEKIAKARQLKFTIFVDDITFSGEGLNRKFVSLIKRVTVRHGHTLHPQKTKIYRANSVKNVTGAAINGNELTLSQKSLKSIYSDMSVWLSSDKSVPDKKLEDRLHGKLISQSGIDPRYKDKARSFRSTVSN